jgi:hypothetical protein
MHRIAEELAAMKHYQRRMVHGRVVTCLPEGWTVGNGLQGRPGQSEPMALADAAAVLASIEFAGGR